MYQRTIILIVILALVIGGFFIVLRDYVRTDEPNLGSSTEHVALVQEGGVSIAQTEISDVSVKPPYVKAVALYKGKTLTFDTNCGVAPLTMSVPYKSTILIDNRSDETRRIGIGSRYITINPRDFFITTMNRKGDQSVRCDGLQNIAVVRVE